MVSLKIFKSFAEGLLELLRGAQGWILAGGLHEMEQFGFNRVEVEDLLDLLRHGRSRWQERRRFVLAHGRQLLRFIELRGADIRVEADGVGDSVFHNIKAFRLYPTAVTPSLPYQANLWLAVAASFHRHSKRPVNSGWFSSRIGAAVMNMPPNCGLQAAWTAYGRRCAG